MEIKLQFAGKCSTFFHILLAFAPHAQFLYMFLIVDVRNVDCEIILLERAQKNFTLKDVDINSLRSLIYPAGQDI